VDAKENAPGPKENAPWLNPPKQPRRIALAALEALIPRTTFIDGDDK